jgi:hypothetical protein
MTEGRVRIGTVSIFGKGQFLRNVSITLLNKDGRASANAPGYGSPGRRAEHFVLSNNQFECGADAGHA